MLSGAQTKDDCPKTSSIFKYGQISTCFELFLNFDKNDISMTQLVAFICYFLLFG